MADFTAAQLDEEAQRLFSLLGSVTDFKDGRKYTLPRCRELSPLTLKINTLKKRNDAVVLAHYYCTPDIVYGVADFKGDSYALAKKASETDCKNIIFCGVYFMAQTAKIINPNKRVYLPPVKAGCSLADGITAEEVQKLKKLYPDAAFVCYINSTAEVKAFCDVCVTSSNVYDIVAALPNKQIVFVPDLFMAENIRAELKRRSVEKEILAFGATCCVHDKYTVEDIEKIKAAHPQAKIICHPECSRGVCNLSDYCGSTSGMLSYVKKVKTTYPHLHNAEGAAEYLKNRKPAEFAVFSEQGIINSLEAENPSEIFYAVGRPCVEMKRNTLADIAAVLENLETAPQVEVDGEIALKAKNCIDNMFKMAGK